MRDDVSITTTATLLGTGIVRVETARILLRAGVDVIAPMAINGTVVREIMGAAGTAAD
ncbi:hypothetical protein [Demequina aurantiaca]|uniref:hypothetical protein n=1 Tax=Demequina aurantiaca TaxID=676200 RepID=UPI003D32C613